MVNLKVSGDAVEVCRVLVRLSLPAQRRGDARIRSPLSSAGGFTRVGQRPRLPLSRALLVVALSLPGHSYELLPTVIWTENNCTEGNSDVVVGKEQYLVSGDGYLMPITKDQRPPDLRYFKNQ